MRIKIVQSYDDCDRFFILSRGKISLYMERLRDSFSIADDVLTKDIFILARVSYNLEHPRCAFKGRLFDLILTHFMVRS